MKKRFWTRLISAVLTMAMAFSILAVPASAASSENSWAIGMGSVEGFEWVTELGAPLMVARNNHIDVGEVTPDMVEKFKEGMLATGYAEEYPDPDRIPDGAYMGMEVDGTLYWYGEDTATALLKDGQSDVKPEYSVDGIITISGVEYKPISSMSAPQRKVIAECSPMNWMKMEYDLELYEWEPMLASEIRVGLVMLKMAIEKGNLEDWLESYPDEINIEPLKEKNLEDIAAMSEDEVIACLKEMDYPFVEVPVNTAYIGVSNAVDGEVSWYTEEQWDAIQKALNDANDSGNDVTVEWENGVFTVGDETFAPMEIAAASAGKDSSINVGMAVAAAVGAAAVATGVYFYTHPEKVEEIKTFFADLSANVQAKVQEFTANVKGAFGIVPEQEDEEDAPVAETAEAAQAA